MVWLTRATPLGGGRRKRGSPPAGDERGGFGGPKGSHHWNPGALAKGRDQLVVDGIGARRDRLQSLRPVDMSDCRNELSLFFEILAS